MGHLTISLAALLASAWTYMPATAQPAKPEDPVEGSAEEVPPIGYVLVPGVTFVPSAFTEIGYDSNPNQTFFNKSGSGFIRSGGGFTLSGVTPSTVASLSANGSMMDYFDTSIFEDSLRFAGSASGNLAYLVKPGVTASTGAYINYDGQSVNRNQTEGANVELGFRDSLLASVVRARFSGVQYLNQDVTMASPIALGSTFNSNRSEVSWTGLLGNSWPIAPYAEGSAARVDYPNQPFPDLVNRNADDYHAKIGARWTASPAFYADIGWRFNWRETEDLHIPFYSSNFFDGGLNWRPSPFFFVSASVERYIGEPSTNYAVMADVRSYGFKATYLPVPGVSVTGAAGWQVVNDIGSGVHYHAPTASGQVAWNYNNHVQFYTAVQYQGYNIDWQYLEFNEVRVMAGIRLVPDGQDLVHGESFDSLMARLADANRPAGSLLSVSAGYSWFGLPDMRMVTTVGGPFFNQALGQEKNGDGSLDGMRADASLSNFAQASLPGGQRVSFGVSGFFANYQGTTNSNCMYSLTTDCAIVNIVDSDPSVPNNTGPFGNLVVRVNRNVDYYGVAIDARLGSLGGVSFKDAPPAQPLSPFKVGVAMRGLEETSKLTSFDPLVSSPVSYKETLNTHYYGGYVGVEEKEAFPGGWTFGVDARAGLYYTDTQYQGRYNGYTAILPFGYFQECGYVDANVDRGSFIGSLRLDIQRQIGWGMVGVFAQGEYLSYVPRVLYNNNDQATGVVWGGINGTQPGTHITAADAFNFTTGLNVSLQMN